MDIQAWGRAASETVDATNARLVRLIERAQQDPGLNRRVEQFMVLGPPWQATDWRETERRANQSLDGVRNPFEADPEALDHYQTVQALGWCDLYEQALGLVELAFEAATANASITGHVLASTYRADVHLRRGDFAEAEADARAALELIDDRRLEIPAALSFAWLVMALVERDKAGDAWEALRERGFDEEIPEQGIFGFLYGARAVLHLAGHEPRRALDDALRAGHLFSTIGPGPSPSPWRSTAALAAHARGQEEQARELAAEDLELARRFGAPRPLGIALRTAALVGLGDPVAGLRESVAVLEPSGARAELARSLLELGSAMRRRRHGAAETRAVLREALDASHRCGAAVIERRARDELLAAGGRPRRASTRGLDALTPRELRVAQLAAAGSTNRQIAQALFVTPRTIEHHLRSTYTKLGITSREGLPEALGTGPVSKVDGLAERRLARPR
jgi:DNA-binding CsgD family transcriptional regulator